MAVVNIKKKKGFFWIPPSTTPTYKLTIERTDGTIDDIVRGTISLEKMQTLYSEVIKKGLDKNELIKADNMILVK